MARCSALNATRVHCRTRSLDRTRAGDVSFQFGYHWPPASVDSIVRRGKTRAMKPRAEFARADFGRRGPRGFADVLQPLSVGLGSRNVARSFPIEVAFQPACE
jgi:hypothetical protein